MDKKQLTEQDIRTKYITPAIERAGWDRMTQLREEHRITNGRIMVRGRKVKRAAAKFADYVLRHRPNLSIAVVEAKDNNHSVGDGMQQGLDYAESMQVPFVFSSNGDGFLFHDKTAAQLGGDIERELTLYEFPSPNDLWSRYCQWKGFTAERREIVEQDYYSDGSGKQPRYDQLNAINRMIEAVADGQNRVLLVMATGTGKTPLISMKESACRR
ncbi:hypothetical protein GC176_28045 [bacterium]|nr:hypothetical protein [bacterium]